MIFSEKFKTQAETIRLIIIHKKTSRLSPEGFTKSHLDSLITFPGMKLLPALLYLEKK
jgi:hypothetical protein